MENNHLCLGNLIGQSESYKSYYTLELFTIEVAFNIIEQLAAHAFEIGTSSSNSNDFFSCKSRLH